MPTKKTDFNIDDLVKTGSKHDEEISGLKKRVKIIEDKFGDNEKIADTLCATADTQLKMQEMLQNVFMKQLQSNPVVQEEISKIINKTEKDQFKVWARKIGIGVWTVIVSILSGAIVLIIQTLSRQPVK